MRILAGNNVAPSPSPPDGWRPNGELDCGSLGACWRQVALVLSDPAPGASLATAFTYTGIAFLLLVLITFFYNANWHSMYHLYRNRLARCFLGATHSKHRETPARFDPKDDIALADIRVRPLHIFNATLNLVGSRELAWQTRKAVSFFFTPFRCGYALSKAGKNGDDIECFAPIGEYMTPEASQDHEGRSGTKRPPRDPWTTHSTVGTALTISGAAVAPSQGYLTNKDPFVHHGSVQRAARSLVPQSRSGSARSLVVRRSSAGLADKAQERANPADTRYRPRTSHPLIAGDYRKGRHPLN